MKKLFIGIIIGMLIGMPIAWAFPLYNIILIDSVGVEITASNPLSVQGV